MKAVIISNGSILDYSLHNKYFENDPYIICADGGASHARRFNVVPNVLLGDFDSLPEDDFRYFKELGIEIIGFNKEKDMTDTELAAMLAVDKGFKEIIFLGGVGSRLDHSLANVFLLKKLLDMGVTGVIANENNEIFLIRDKATLKKEEGIKVSLLPLTFEVKGVTTKGFYYPLDGATLTMGSSLGISNEFVSDVAEVSVESGILTVIKSRD